MSKRAEEAALMAYPYEGGMKGLICENSRQVFIQGYEQAEKDLALTWEDMKMIFKIADNYDSEFERPYIGSDAYYQEVLRRFIEQKNEQ